jgi:Concanavalin A-like lectin/glucanases superfamily
MIRKIALPAALFALALTAPVASANTGLVGEWQMNEGRGTVVGDSSGYGNTGTITGGVRWTSGPGGSALSFDGATGQVRVPDAPQLEPSTAVSVAAWVARVGSPGDYKYMVAKGGQGCISASYGLYSGPNGGLEFYISRGHGTTYARSPDAGSSVWDGRWHLAVGTFDGTTIRLYLDGAQVGSGIVYPGPIEYLLSDANDLFIGAYPSCANEDFNGTTSDVRIWNRALSAAEISALTAPAQPPPTGGGNPSSTAPAAGGTAANGGGSGATGTGAGTPQASPPVIAGVSLSSSTLTVGSGGSGSRLTPLIAYNDSASSQVTFTILQVQSKVMQTRCIKAARDRRRNPIGYCPRLVALGRFVHQDHRGHNTVRFPRALTPSPGNYVLDVTPSLYGKVGKTIAVRFRVVTARRG